jgi:hypothetical protein
VIADSLSQGGPGIAVWPLAAGDRSHDEKGLCARGDGFGKRGIRRVEGEVLRAGEEPQERPPALRHVVTDCPAKHRITGFKGVED